MDFEGNPYSKEFYEKYCRQPLSPETRENAVEDLTMRIKLLLGPLAKEPRKFRRAYRHLAQVFDDEKAAAELSDLDIAEYAQRYGKASQQQATVATLDTMRGLRDDAEWHGIKKIKGLKPEDKIQLIVEEQPHWPKHGHMTAPDSGRTFIGDYAHGRRRVWRMVLPDGTPFAVAYIDTYSEGLGQKLPTELSTDVKPAKKVK